MESCLDEDDSLSSLTPLEVEQSPAPEDTNQESVFVATVADMHPILGTLADLLVDSTELPVAGKMLVRFREPSGRFLGKTIGLGVSRLSPEPVQFVRLSIKHVRVFEENWQNERPVVLRLYRRDKLSGILPLDGGPVSTVSVTREAGKRLAGEAIGFLTDGVFREVIPLNTELPRITKVRFTTARPNQKRMHIVAAVRTPEETTPVAKVRMKVLSAPAGVPWVECTLRLDFDGKLTLIAYEPVFQQRRYALAAK